MDEWSENTAAADGMPVDSLLTMSIAWTRVFLDTTQHGGRAETEVQG